MNIVINSFEALQSASHNAIDTSSIQAAREHLAKAEVSFNNVENDIKNANSQQQKFNSNINGGQSAAGGLVSKLMRVGSSITGFSAEKILELSDNLTSAKARLGLINDGLQTNAQLQDMVFQSAQKSRTSYMDTAQVVSKLGLLAGDAFSSNQETVKFAELMNKQFKIGGSSISEQTSAMYQLTQSMAAGKLQGDEFRTITENAPMLAKAIEKYMGDQGVAGTLKDLSAKGLITSDVIKKAMFSSADEVEAKFKNMPMTFGQVWTVVQNDIIKTFDPLIQIIGKGAQFIGDNWSILEPIFWGLAAAVGAYTVMTAIQTAVTWLSVAANRALAIALLTNPILLIAVVIGIIIGVIYKWVQSVGGIKVAWLICVNAILTAWDWVKIAFFTGVFWVIDLWDKMALGLKTASVGIQNFMGDMKANVLILLQNMVNGAIGIINDFIRILNKLPGVSIDIINDVTFGTEAKIQNEAEKKARNADLSKYKSDIENNIAERDATLNKMKADARNATQQRESKIKIAMEEAKAKKPDINDDIKKNIENTAVNTGNMSDAMDASEEDLQYLRDLAERDVVNRFTTAEIKVDMTNHNNVHSNMDLDGVVSYLEETIYQTMSVAAEGVHT